MQLFEPKNIELFSDRIREVMIYLGFTQRQLADYLNVSTGSVSRWVNDNVVPKNFILTFNKLHNKHGIDINWLKTGKGNPTNTKYIDNSLTISGSKVNQVGEDNTIYKQSKSTDRAIRVLEDELIRSHDSLQKALDNESKLMDLLSEVIKKK